MNQYGFFQKNSSLLPPQGKPWPELECRELQSLRLGKHKGSGAMLKRLGQLVDLACPARASGESETQIIQETQMESASSSQAQRASQAIGTGADVRFPAMAMAASPDFLAAVFLSEARTSLMEGAMKPDAPQIRLGALSTLLSS